MHKEALDIRDYKVLLCGLMAIPVRKCLTVIAHGTHAVCFIFMPQAPGALLSNLTL